MRYLAIVLVAVLATGCGLIRRVGTDQIRVKGVVVAVSESQDVVAHGGPAWWVVTLHTRAGEVSLLASPTAAPWRLREYSEVTCWASIMRGRLVATKCKTKGDRDE